jgi:hypothetical protein
MELKAEISTESDVVGPFKFIESNNNSFKFFIYLRAELNSQWLIIVIIIILCLLR